MDLYLVNTGFLRSSDTRSADDLYFWDNWNWRKWLDWCFTALYMSGSMSTVLELIIIIPLYLHITSHADGRCRGRQMGIKSWLTAVVGATSRAVTEQTRLWSTRNWTEFNIILFLHHCFRIDNTGIWFFVRRIFKNHNCAWSKFIMIVRISSSPFYANSHLNRQVWRSLKDCARNFICDNFSCWTEQGFEEGCVGWEIEVLFSNLLQTGGFPCRIEVGFLFVDW